MCKNSFTFSHTGGKMAREVMKMKNKTFGYIRVSSNEQNLQRQYDSIIKYVSDERDIFCDKQSGKNLDRPGYQALKQTLREGDTLYVHSLDRLSRNKSDIVQELQGFRSKGITVKILDIPTSLMDYSKFGDMQIGIMDMVNNILIEVLATIAQTERERIKSRQAEGIKSAKARGIHLGRKPKEIPSTWEDDYQLWSSKKITATSLCKKYGWSRSTFYSYINEYKSQQ